MKNPKGVYAKGTHDIGSGGENPKINPDYKNVSADNLSSATKGRALTSGYVRAMRKGGTKNKLQSAESAMSKVNGNVCPK